MSSEPAVDTEIDADDASAQQLAVGELLGCYTLQIGSPVLVTLRQPMLIMLATQEGSTARYVLAIEGTICADHKHGIGVLARHLLIAKGDGRADAAAVRMRIVIGESNIAGAVLLDDEPENEDEAEAAAADGAAIACADDVPRPTP